MFFQKVTVPQNGPVGPSTGPTVPSSNSPILQGQSIHRPSLTIFTSKLQPIPHRQDAYIHNHIRDAF